MKECVEGGCQQKPAWMALAILQGVDNRVGGMQVRLLSQRCQARSD